MKRLVLAHSVALMMVVVALCPAGCGGRGSTRPDIVDDSAGRVTGTRTDGASMIFKPSTTAASAQNPAFSPDGTNMLFTVFLEGYNDGPAGLYLVSANGARPETLLFEDGHDSVNLPGSCWNDATGKITFSSDREDADEIWTISPDGSGAFRVTRHGEATYYLEPSFSPDGQWVVFEVDVGLPEQEQRGSVWKVRSDGTGGASLTDGPGGGTDDRQPNWSPAGDRILFQRRMPGSDDWNIFTMAPDGSDISQVTRSEAADTDASWSPDGRFIVYSSDDGTLEHPNIFAIGAGGGEPVRVTHSDTREDGAPSWSPDGKWIAFESHSDEDESTPTAIWKIEAPSGL